MSAKDDLDAAMIMLGTELARAKKTASPFLRRLIDALIGEIQKEQVAQCAGKRGRSFVARWKKAGFQWKRSEDRQHYVVLKGPNGAVLFTSEMYATKRAAEDGVISAILSVVGGMGRL